MDSISESINVGIVIRPKRYYTSKDEGTPAFRNCNIQGGSIDDSEWVYLKATAAKENPRSVVRYGDVLIARSGNAGNCCVVPKAYSGYGAIDVIIARPLLKFVSPDFLAVNLCAASTQTMLASISRGVALSHLGVTTISSLPMPLPPLAEQKRIVAKVKELFAIADSLGVAADGLENAARRLDKKILDLAIRGKLVPQDPSDEPASELVKRIDASHKSPCKNQSEPIDPPFAIPQSWEWMRLGDILHPMTSKKPTGETFDYIDIDAIDNKQHIVKVAKTLQTKGATSRASREVKSGDVLFSMVRPYLRNIALIDEGYAHCIASTGFYVCRPSDVLYPPYLYHLMLSDYVVMGLNESMKGLNSPGITTGDLQRFPIPLPPLAEQKRIVAKIEELRAVIKPLTM